jgi:SH3-like domain-containing protein
MPTDNKLFIRFKIPSLEEVLKTEGWDSNAIQKLLVSAQQKYGDLRKLTPGKYSIPIFSPNRSVTGSVDVEIPGPERILPTLGYTGTVLQTILEILEKQPKLTVGEYTLSITLDGIPAANTPYFYVKVRMVNLRSTPEIKTDNIVEILLYGTNLISLETRQDIWYKVKTEDKKEGWLTAEVLSQTPVPSDLYVSKERTELWSNRIDMTGTVLATLPYGTHVRFTQIKDLWYNVQLDDGRKGWVYGLALSPERPISLPQTDELTASIRKIFNITGAFEGGDGFSNLSGNFDGQGISFGFLQWNFGQDSLQPLLKRMNEKNPSKFRAIFKDGTDQLLSVLNSNNHETQMKFARSINDSKSRIIEPWNSRFKTLGKESEFQDVQIEFAQSFVSKAKSLCKEYGLRTERGLSLMFDIAVQNGDISKDTKARIMEDRQRKEAELKRSLTEKEFLEIIANRRAEASKPRWVEDVRSRKLTIAKGRGNVHGKYYDLDQEFGLSDKIIL